MSTHVLLTTELWRKIAENHNDVYVYFREHGIRLSYVMYSRGKVDTLEFTNEKWALLFELDYGVHLERISLDNAVTRCYQPEG